MNKIYFLIAGILLFVSSCVPSFDEVGVLPDDPSILEVLVGNENGKIAQENAIYSETLTDTVWVKDRTADFTNVYLNGNFAAGCTVEPLNGSPKMGEYGDFSSAVKYRVTAPTGNSADWTVILDYYTPPVGCLADRWAGNVTCTDGVWSSYSPATCFGEKMDGDCQKLKLSFDFWADSSAPVELELELGDIDFDTFMGDITLTKDVNFTSYGADMTFHAGAAGTYNATANILNLNLEFSGYDIGGEYYPFTITQ
ncbi:DUF5018-related domain-containing protein [Draconibacterium orientale]|uniref:DUF5018-related domain-containing protein n=1 Tax=Draconibacterium orientale TaxID=1168034 RepID=UPI0029BFF956|nr:hypothetical protein [Draconibacterium orientale]